MTLLIALLLLEHTGHLSLGYVLIACFAWLCHVLWQFARA